MKAIIKKLFCGLCVFFYFINPSFANNFLDQIQGEWERSCGKIEVGPYFFVMKTAHIGNNVVYSWKWYNDSSCKDLVGEFWSHWEITIEGPSQTVADAYDAQYRVIDGPTTDGACQVLLDTIMRQDAFLFGGDKYNEKGWTPCMTKPQEMDTIPYVFVKHLPEQTVMQYIENNQLKRNPTKLRKGEYVTIWEKSPELTHE